MKLKVMRRAMERAINLMNSATLSPEHYSHSKYEGPDISFSFKATYLSWNTEEGSGKCVATLSIAPVSTFSLPHIR